MGTPGRDTITGTAELDVIVALGGNDSIYGLGGDCRGRTNTDAAAGCEQVSSVP